MKSILFILNEAPYGSERSYNALRIAATLAAQPGTGVRVFLIGDAVACAKAGQKVPEGFYNIQLMLGKVTRSGEIGACGTCLDARGIVEAEMAPGVQRSTLAELAGWTNDAAQVLVF